MLKNLHQSGTELKKVWIVSPTKFFLENEIHSMQGWTSTTKQGVTKKEAQKEKNIHEICLQRTYS